MRSRRGLVLALAAAACATVPKPEGPVPVTPGERVRVTLASRVATGPLQGDVLSISPDTLVVAREEGGERRLPRRQVDEIEVSVGRVRDPGRAAGYGILAAAPLLVPLVVVAFVLPYEGGSAAVTWLVVPVAGLAAIGALMGGGPQDVWVDAVWPVSAETSSADAPADSLAADSLPQGTR